MGTKIQDVSNFLSQSFQFLKINSKNNNKIFNVCILFSKIKKNDLENSKHLKFLNPTKFQYEKFNKSDKSKFKHYLIYFLN
jgi:hypothetical protein